jgi:hypothetical protein
MSESRFIACLVPPAVRAELERAAAANERSLSGEIRIALKEHLEDPGGGFSSSHRSDVDRGQESGDHVDDRRSPPLTEQP